MIRRRLRRDDGFTLTEMIAAAAIFSLVSLALGGVMISITNAQTQVTTSTSATSMAQATADSIDSGVRNASALNLEASGSDQLLVAKVAGAGTTLTWHCRGWFYSSSDGGKIWMTQTADGTKITVPDAAELASWTLLVDGVTPSSGSTVFTRSGSSVEVGFLVAVTGTSPVQMDFTTTSLLGVSEDASCF
jgi:prepilin-type N-terminal cleavage/methylation domain-containing protein